MDIFADFEIIHIVTREDLLEDGSLVDVSELAREAGIRFPVAISCGLWADINTIPEAHSYQDPKGRLWDVLWMFRCSAARVPETVSEFRYRLIMHVGDSENYFVKAVCGPGDNLEPVITLLRPDED